MAKKAKLVTKVIKKTWIPLIAPKELNERPIGEAYVLDPKSLIGKSVTTNLMTITNDIKMQNINITLKIVKATPEKAFTECVGFSVVPSTMRRLVRRGKSRIDHVVQCTTKNGKQIAVKVFIVTNAIAYNSIATKMRRIVASAIKEIAANSAYEALVRDIISHRIQNDLREVLRKVYPIRICEVRALEILKEKFHDLEKKSDDAGNKPDAEEPVAEVTELDDETALKAKKPLKETEQQAV